ncbi:MAG: hypothetical protein KDC71_02280 [Acidobacteria bacterium]|nr:hypothetical protein [Acidobacteriota bacterium]
MKLVFKERPRSAVAWAEEVEGWAKSGLSKAAYCREHGLNYAQFFYRAARHAENRISKLVPVPGVDFGKEKSSGKDLSSGSVAGLTIRMGRFVLEISSERVDEQHLVSVLRAMKAVE